MQVYSKLLSENTVKGIRPTDYVQLMSHTVPANLSLFFVLVDLAGMAPLLGTTICFAVAVSQNYAVNELWTFAVEGKGRLAWQRY